MEGAVLFRGLRLGGANAREGREGVPGAGGPVGEEGGQGGGDREWQGGVTGGGGGAGCVQEGGWARATGRELGTGMRVSGWWGARRGVSGLGGGGQSLHLLDR